MFPAPVIVRGENHYPGDEANDVIGQLDLRKDPWPQSCIMMNTRTTTAPDRMVSDSVKRCEIFRLQYIRNQRRTYRATLLVSCQAALSAEGFWNFATTGFHSATLAFCRSWPAATVASNAVAAIRALMMRPF